MKKAIPFLALVFAAAGLIPFLAGGPGDLAANPSPQDKAAKAKPTFNGEFEFRENLEYTSHGYHKLDLRANIPFQIAWNDKVGAWAIKGAVKDAKGTSEMSSNKMTCQADLKGKIDMDGFVSGEKLKACKFKLNINQEWEDYVFDCSGPNLPHLPIEEGGFTLNHVFDYVTEATPHSKEVQAGIMKGHLYLQLKKFSGTLIEQCGVMY
jgi:hypothetical protein